MMRIALLAALLTLSCLPFASAQRHAPISWTPERLLSWDDFKARPDNSVPYAAYTVGTLSYKTEYVSANDYFLHLQVEFDPRQSWYKAKIATDYLLRHEQLHFDIYELHTRILVKRLTEQSILQGRRALDRLHNEFQKVLAEMRDYQQLYDLETRHSKDKAQQAVWEAKIRAQMAEYSAYAQRSIPFSM